MSSRITDIYKLDVMETKEFLKPLKHDYPEIWNTGCNSYTACRIMSLGKLGNSGRKVQNSKVTQDQTFHHFCLHF
jgi:hypothetical protein